MNRKLISPSDYPALKPFFKKQPYNLSVYSLSSIIAWNTGPIKSYYRVDENRLIIASESSVNAGERYLILPISERGFLTPEELHDIAVDHGYRKYRFVSGNYLEAYERKKIELWFEIAEEPQYADYVYRTSDLIDLKGNRYTKKRNLIHQFVRDYVVDNRVSVSNIEPGKIDMYLDFLEKWCDERHCDQNESLLCEKKAFTKTLIHMDLLEIKGIVVMIDGLVSALAMASELNDKTGVLHFEKAFSSIRGLYQFLDNECARRLFAECEFINKESDMNIDELAQSKKSYHPVERVKSCCLKLR